MNTFKRALDILILTAPLVNLSFIPGSNLPIIYMVTLFLALVILTTVRKIPASVFGGEDLFYALFVLAAITSYFINYSNYPGYSGLYQVINLLLTYLVFKIALILIHKSLTSPQKILGQIYRTNTAYCIAAIVIYVIGLFDPGFLDQQILFFNNSGNFFPGGGIGHSFATARSFGFSPEPSFWSFFVATNIALGLVIKDRNKAFLVVNIINLVLTFGRTGYLVAAAIIVIKFAKTSTINRLFTFLLFLLTLYIYVGDISVRSIKDIDISVSQRIDSLIVSFKIIGENLFFGIGLGNFKVWAESRNLPYTDIFNLFLNILVSSGLVGFSLFAIVLFTIFRKIRNSVNLPFYAAMVGWMTLSAYNLPFLWIIFAALMYHKTKSDEEFAVFKPAL